MTRHHGRHDCRLFVPLSCHFSCTLGLKFSALIHIVATEIGWLVCELCVQCSREIGSLSTFASASLYLSLPTPASSWLLTEKEKKGTSPTVRLQHRYVGKKQGGGGGVLREQHPWVALQQLPSLGANTCNIRWRSWGRLRASAGAASQWQRGRGSPPPSALVSICRTQ